MANLRRSKIGRAWIAIRDNDIAAEALGVNIVLYKLLAFFVAGFFGGNCWGFLGDFPGGSQPGAFSVRLVSLVVGCRPHWRSGEHPRHFLGSAVYDFDPRGLEGLDFHTDPESFFVDLMPFLPSSP